MSYRTHLANVRGLGSAKDGTRHFWAQRLTAMALVPLLLWFVISLVAMSGADYATVVAWVRSPLVTILLLAFIGAGFYHGQLGIQVVIEDYVHHEQLKLLLIVLLNFAAILCGAAAAIAVLRVAFGG
jgi:succinate dehydrogenase / fumarate reductase membrane anchor subunit